MRAHIISDVKVGINLETTNGDKNQLRQIWHKTAFSFNLVLTLVIECQELST